MANRHWKTFSRDSEFEIQDSPSKGMTSAERLFQMHELWRKFFRPHQESPLNKEGLDRIEFEKREGTNRRMQGRSRTERNGIN